MNTVVYMYILRNQVSNGLSAVQCKIVKELIKVLINSLVQTFG